MPGLVAQYPVAPFTTPINGDDLDAALVVSHDSSIASAHTSHDADPSIHFQSSTLAARPGAGVVGRKWITTDGLRVYYDTGAAWSEIDYLCKTAGGTVAGATTFSAVLTSTGGIAISTGAGVTPLSLIGINAFSRISRNEAAFAGALLQFDRSGVVAGYVGMDAADNLTIQRGADAVLAVTINRVTGAATFAGAVTTGALTATTLTGTLQTAAQPNVTSLGTLTALTVSGAASFQADKITIGSGRSPTEGLQALFGTSSVVSSVGTRVSAGSVVIAHNASQPTNSVDLWTQSLGAIASQMFELHSSGFDLYHAVAGRANGALAAFWGTPELSMAAGRLLVGTAVTTNSNPGDVVLIAGRGIRCVDAAGTGTRTLISGTNSGGTNFIALGSQPDIILIGGAGSFASALTGEMVLPNVRALRGVNAATTNTLALIQLSAADKVAIDANAVGATFGAGAVFAGALSGITTVGASGAITAGSFVGPLTGNASTATALQTARAINGVNFDGTAAITVAAAAGTLTGATLAAGVTNSSLTQFGSIVALDVGVAHVKAGATTAVGVGSATTIYTAVNSGGYAVVFGSSGGRVFCDTITWDTGTSQIFAITSTVIAGVPSGRTYSLSGSNIQLTMAAAATSVKLLPIEFN